MAQHAGGQVDAHHLGTLAAQPPGGGRGPAAHFQHPPAGHVAQQPGVRFAYPLGAPDEVHVAEEAPVLGLVRVGVAVPPAAAGPPILVATDRPPGHTGLTTHAANGTTTRNALIGLGGGLDLVVLRTVGLSMHSWVACLGREQTRSRRLQPVTFFR